MKPLKRNLNIAELLKKKSFFLFGPRSTGKSTLIRQSFVSSDSFLIDLLDGRVHLKLSSNPAALEELVDLHKSKIIIIDEVQKIPELLNEVHRLIEKKKVRFLLTGSSARKLRHGGANLLAGRAWEAQLFPLVWKELKKFNLEKMLQFGGLPQVYLSQDPKEELSAYVNTYLREEIRAEGLVKKFPQFSRFLKVAALSNGQLVNYSMIASDAAVPASTVREYFSILNDTLIGFNLEPWRESKKRKAIETAKFYFFDTGVTHTLAGTDYLDRNSDLYGRSFEQWIGMELRAYLSYRRIKKELLFWRSINGQEVDFVIGDSHAIEVKASQKISRKHLSGLIALREEGVHKNFYCVSHDPIESKAKGITCLHWKTFISRLWADALVS